MKISLLILSAICLGGSPDCKGLDISGLTGAPDGAMENENMLETREGSKLNCMTTDLEGVDQGAHGYDIWSGDMWARYGDPGRKQLIFDIHCYGSKVGTGSYHQSDPGYYSFATAVIDTNCRSTFSSERISNYKDYLGMVSSSNEYALDTSFSHKTEASAFGFGVNLEVEASFSMSGNSEYKSMQKLFQEKQGEVTISKATCNTIDLTFNPYLRPKFSDGFIAALGDIQKAIDSGSQLDQDRAMMKFMKTFGTHYSIKTQLGAMLIFEERFTSRSTDSQQSTTRKQCSKWAANGCIGGGVSGGMSGFEIDSSTKACAGYSSGKCSGSDYDSSWGDQNSLSRTTSRTIGSYPSDLNDWSNYLSQKENQNLVVPIQRQLVLISNLFKKEWLSKNDDFGFSKDLDGDALTRLFNSTAENYCQKILGRTYTECHPDIKGCGINDNCGFNAKCINDPSSAKGYKCYQKEIVPSRPKGSTCARPAGWCRGVSEKSEQYLMIDCDGDGIPDPVCSSMNGNLAVLYSSKGCPWPSAESWPHAECGRVCQKPGGWCKGQTQTYLLTDCDGDGIPDPVCSDTNGSLGVVYSSKGCRQSWSNAQCTVKI